MARINGHCTGRTEIHIAQAEYQIAGTEDDVAYLLGGIQAVNAANEFHIVGQPGRITADGFLITLHRIQGGAVFECHGQMQDARGDHPLVHAADGFFPFQQSADQGCLVDQAGIVVDLQAANARRQLQNTADRGAFEVLHERMHTHAQGQVEHVVAVLDKDVLVARLAINDTRYVALGIVFGEHGGRRAGRVVIGDGGLYHWNNTQILDGGILGFFQCLGFSEADRREANAVAGFELADFPQFGFGNGHRAHKPAEAGAILGQDNREIAGEIDGANGVFIIVHVGGMQAGFAAVGACPARLRADQTDAQPVGVVVHLPVRLEKFFDGLFGEKVRRAVGAVQHLDVPLLGVVGEQVFFCRVRVGYGCGRGAAGQLGLAHGEHVAFAQGAATVAAELAQHKGGFAAQIIRYIDTVAHGNVGSAAAFDLAGGQGLAGLDGNRFPEIDRVAIHLRVTLCAGEGNYRVAMEFQARAHQGGFKAGGAVMVADDAVGEPEGDIIHGAGWRHANVPVTGAAGVVLHGGVSAGVDNFERHGRVVKGFQVTGRDGAGDDILVAQNLAQVIQVGGNTGQTGLRQCGLHLLQCILAIVTVDNKFGDHGIVMGAYHRAGLYPAVQTNVIREGDFGELAGAGLEIF